MSAFWRVNCGCFWSSNQWLPCYKTYGWTLTITVHFCLHNCTFYFYSIKLTVLINIWCGSMFQSPREQSIKAVVVPTAYVVPFIWNVGTQILSMKYQILLVWTSALRSEKWNQKKKHHRYGAWIIQRWKNPLNLWFYAAVSRFVWWASFKKGFTVYRWKLGLKQWVE